MGQSQVIFTINGYLDSFPEMKVLGDTLCLFTNPFFAKFLLPSGKLTWQVPTTDFAQQAGHQPMGSLTLMEIHTSSHLTRDNSNRVARVKVCCSPPQNIRKQRKENLVERMARISGYVSRWWIFQVQYEQLGQWCLCRRITRNPRCFSEEPRSMGLLDMKPTINRHILPSWTSRRVIRSRQTGGMTDHPL